MRPACLGSGLVLAVLVTGCATAINSPLQSVTIWSEPPGAQAVVDGRLHVTTPGTIQLSRLSDHRITVEREGYEPAVLHVERSMSLWTLLNVVCLPFVVQCVQKDRKEGGFYAFEDELQVRLVRRAAAERAGSPSAPGDEGSGTSAASAFPPGSPP